MYPWFTDLYKQQLMAFQQGRSHHAVLYIADNQIGVDEYTLQLAKAMLCMDEVSKPCNKCKSCKLFSANAHPDFHCVVSDKFQIGIDSIRALTETIYKTAQLSGNKVVVINEFEALTESASNAILKTLEEPTDNTYLLLSTTNAYSILPTIRSRCEQITVNTPTYAQSSEYLQSIGIHPPSISALKAYSESPLLYAKSLGEGVNDFDTFKCDVAIFLDNSMPLQRFVEKYAGDPVTTANWLYYVAFEQILEKSIAKSEYKESKLALLNWLDKNFINIKERLSHQGVNKVILLQEMMQGYKNLSNYG